jgi:hypothetical protein
VLRGARYSRDKTVCDGEAERHEYHGDERGDRVANISPVDVDYGSCHHASNLHRILQVSVQLRHGKREGWLEKMGTNTKISVHPVAHGGIDAKIGAKKMEIRKQIPVVTAVSPVFPPSAIPAADSTNAVTGDVPSSEPIVIDIASVQYASVDRGKSPVDSSTTPENRAIEYSVPVQSRISTYRNVNSANAN